MPIARSLQGKPEVPGAIFPLTVSPTGRYLLTASSVPFLLMLDSPSSMEVQLTPAQIDTYLNDRQARGVTGIVVEAFEHKFSSQSPAYLNANGDAPFTTMSPVDFSAPNEPYWKIVDYIVNGAKRRGIVVLLAISYLGFSGGSEGWMSDITADTGAHLQALGSFYANRFQQGNVIVVALGDYSGTQTERDKHWNIVTGMKTAKPNVRPMITGWPARSDGEAYPQLSGYSDYLANGLNSIYSAADGTDAYSLAATAYARTQPFILIESGVENSNTLLELRRGWYGAMLSGACGCLFQNIPLWGFGEPNFNGGAGAANALSTALNSTGIQQFTYLSNLLTAYSWWLGVPKTDTSLVSTSLSSGTTRIYPMVSSDGTWGMVYVPTSSTPTVVMTAFSKGSMRARFYDPTAGTYSNVTGTPFANTGTQSISVSGETIIVFD